MMPWLPDAPARSCYFVLYALTLWIERGMKYQKTNAPVVRPGRLKLRDLVSDKPMNLSEMMEAMRGFDVRLDGRSGRETLRAILYKKPQIFERQKDGTYKLK